MTWGTTDDARTAPHRPGGGAVAAAIGVGAVGALLGILPWLLQGARLPLQLLWTSPVVDAQQMPLALLPFSPFDATTLAGLLVAGAVLAGGAVRLLRTRLPRRAPLLALGGALLVQLVAIVQSAVATGSGLSMDAPSGAGGTGAQVSDAQIYLVALVLGCLVSVVVGGVVLLVVAAAPPAVAVVGAAAGAVALGPWLTTFVPPTSDDMFSYGPGATTALAVLRWVPAVVTGAAIAATGLRSVGRIAGAVGALVVLWSGTALVTGLAAGLSTRVLLEYPLDLALFGAQVFVSALGPAGVGLSLAGVAALVGAAGALLLRSARRRRDDEGA